MNLSLILFVLSLISGVLWFADVLVFRKQRASEDKDPAWVTWGADFFLVIFAVFLLRSFVVEPFRIPSASMMPTLLAGDFILVNKYTYGIRLPILNKKIISVNAPQRGDVMVFRYPEDPSQDYIKRVVGLPGDKVSYQNKRLNINGEPIAIRPIEDYELVEKRYVSKQYGEQRYYVKQFEEKLGKIEHRILNDANAASFINSVHPFPGRENCVYNSEGVICTVPQGHYFMMGDNRDNSADSRFWGFVPEENIVGRAFFIWLNFSDWKRIGAFK